MKRNEFLIVKAVDNNALGQQDRTVPTADPETVLASESSRYFESQHFMAPERGYLEGNNKKLKGLFPVFFFHTEL
jgi:hypothetical protein